MTVNMAYCTECGVEMEASAKFCSDCGAAVDPTDVPPDEPSEQAVDGADDGGFDVLRGLTSGVMGVFVGAVVALAFANIGGSGVMFLLALVGVAFYLYVRTATTRRAFGSGMYILAIWVLATPILFYGPLAANASNGFAALGGILGMFIWGFIFLLIAIVIAAVGYLVNRGA